MSVKLDWLTVSPRLARLSFRRATDPDLGPNTHHPTNLDRPPQVNDPRHRPATFTSTALATNFSAQSVYSLRCCVIVARKATSVLCGIGCCRGGASAVDTSSGKGTLLDCMMWVFTFEFHSG